MVQVDGGGTRINEAGTALVDDPDQHYAHWVGPAIPISGLAGVES